MLYEMLPDQFPHGQLTDVEIILWNKFAESLKDSHGRS
jgi:hypothetical protein